MRQHLWPSEPGEHEQEIAEYFAGNAREPVEVLLAIDDVGLPIGFVELSIRPYAEGCHTDRVAFIEGWYVAPTARRQGAGRALVLAAEDWAKSQQCTELASDTEADNLISAEAHRAIGFSETAVIRCFKKLL